MVGAAGDQLEAAFAGTVPLGRAGRAEEMAKAVSFSASDAASHVAGSELFVDGRSRRFRSGIQRGSETRQSSLARVPSTREMPSVRPGAPITAWSARRHFGPRHTGHSGCHTCPGDFATHLRRVTSAIPPNFESIDLPHLGKIIYFREGSAWVAVWPNFRDRSTSPIGLGESPGEAVAELVMQERGD